ncbi:MAG: histidine kinase [Bacteroidota bacterium]
MKIVNRKWFILYLFLGVFLLYLALFIISKKAFAFYVLPTSSLVLWIAIGCSFRFFVDWFQKRNEILLLKSKNLESSLAMLRNQINPHFLFNTLHNIDALIGVDQDMASKSLLKLSDIMRYMLNDTNPEEVPVENELQHIRDYVSLEILRVKNEDFVDIVIEGDYKGSNVAPLLFIPFVENAFKHAVDSDIENGITIKFSFNNKIITFICANHYYESEVEKDKTPGIGISIVEKRLKLLYPEKHKLIINKHSSIFEVRLEIDTNEN